MIFYLGVCSLFLLQTSVLQGTFLSLESSVRSKDKLMEVAWMNQRVISILNDLISSLFVLESIMVVGMGFWLLS